MKKCWKKKKEEKKKTEVNLIDFNLSNNEAEANEAIADCFQGIESVAHPSKNNSNKDYQEAGLLQVLLFQF